MADIAIDRNRECIIDCWFHSWFDQEFDSYEKLFSQDIYYSESWGPEYVGIEEIKRWKENWHRHSKLRVWQIKKIYHFDDYSLVEWYFDNESKDGRHEFDGVSLIKWKDNLMSSIKEFGSSLPHYRYFTVKQEKEY